MSKGKIKCKVSDAQLRWSIQKQQLLRGSVAEAQGRKEKLEKNRVGQDIVGIFSFPALLLVRKYTIQSFSRKGTFSYIVKFKAKFKNEYLCRRYIEKGQRLVTSQEARNGGGLEQGGDGGGYTIGQASKPILFADRFCL